MISFKKVLAYVGTTVVLSFSITILTENTVLPHSLNNSVAPTHTTFH